MDNLDRRLIAALRGDGRASVSVLAARLGVTRATVRARMAKLEAGGAILGYTAVLHSDADAMPVRASMMVAIEGKGTEGVIKALDGLTAVQAIHSTNGRWDLVVELGAESLSELDIVLRTIRLVPDISVTETNLHLATLRSKRAASPL